MMRDRRRVQKCGVRCEWWSSVEDGQKTDILAQAYGVESCLLACTGNLLSLCSLNVFVILPERW